MLLTKIVKEWPNSQLLLAISREIPTFGAFSFIFNMFFSNVKIYQWHLNSYLSPPSNSSECAPGFLIRKKVDSGCFQFSSQDAEAKLFGDECWFCQCWLWALWPQRLLESARLSVSNVIWLTKASRGTCMSFLTNMAARLGPEKIDGEHRYFFSLAHL